MRRSACGAWRRELRRRVPGVGTRRLGARRPPTRERICHQTGCGSCSQGVRRTDADAARRLGYLKVPGLCRAPASDAPATPQTHTPPEGGRAEPAAGDMAWSSRENNRGPRWAGRRIKLAAGVAKLLRRQCICDGAAVARDFPVRDRILPDPASGRDTALSIYTVGAAADEEMLVCRRGAGTPARADAAQGLCRACFSGRHTAGPRIAEVRWTLGTAAGDHDRGAPCGASGQGAFAAAGISDGGQTVHEMQERVFPRRPAGGALASQWRAPGEALGRAHAFNTSTTCTLAGQRERRGWLEHGAGRSLRLPELWIEADFYSTERGCGAWPTRGQRPIGASAASTRALKRACYAAALGPNLMYTHNYDCLPGSHLGFDRDLRACGTTGDAVSSSMRSESRLRTEGPTATGPRERAAYAETTCALRTNGPSGHV